MSKILFTDLDGTLLTKDSLISPSTKEVLDLMIQEGHRLVFSSGRPLKSILEVVNHAGLQYPGTYIIANNGSQIYDCASETNIFENRLKREYVDYIFDAGEAAHLHIHTYTDTHIVCRRETKELAFYRDRIHLQPIFSEEPASYLEMEPYKVLAINLESKTRLEDFRDSLSEWADEKVASIFSNDHFLEFFSYTAGKGNGLKYLCNYLNIPLENSYASGDAENDISMLEAAGFGIAMSNGDSRIKEAANYVTQKDNNHDGLAEAIKKYIL